MRAVVLLDNVTGHPIYVDGCWRDNLVAGIRSPRTPFNPGFLSNFCAGSSGFGRV